MARVGPKLLRVSALFALLTALANGALAAPADDARTAFKEGERAFEKDDYVRALERFRRAFTIAPRDAVRFNIGVCLERLGRFKEAVAEYETASTSNELDAARRARARDEAERLRRRLGVVEAQAVAAGAELFVDGERACALPCKVELDPRAHDLVARRGGAEQSKKITLASGETTRVVFELADEPAPKTEPVKPDKPALPPPERAPKANGGGGPGVLTWVGAGAFVVGTAGFIGFGLKARSLEKDYDENPTADTRDEGLRMQTLTNVSIGVVVVGAALVVVDLFVLSKGPKEQTGRRAGVMRF